MTDAAVLYRLWRRYVGSRARPEAGSLTLAIAEVLVEAGYLVRDADNPDVFWDRGCMTPGCDA
jgi:hypothetical protein